MTNADCPQPTTVDMNAAASAVAVEDPPVQVPDLKVSQGDGVVSFDVPDSVLFDTDKATLSSQAEPVIDEVAEQIREQVDEQTTEGSSVPARGIRIDVYGHTDSRGPSDYNQALSERRARAVEGALQRRQLLSGIPVTAHGLGETQPKCRPERRRDRTPIAENMACNRRVVIALTVPRL